MFTTGDNVALRENAVVLVVQILSQEQEIFGYDDIAQRLGCHRNTVYRAMQSLLISKKITRHGSNRHGFRYEVNGSYADA